MNEHRTKGFFTEAYADYADEARPVFSPEEIAACKKLFRTVEPSSCEGGWILADGTRIAVRRHADLAKVFSDERLCSTDSKWGCLRSTSDFTSEALAAGLVRIQFSRTPSVCAVITVWAEPTPDQVETIGEFLETVEAEAAFSEPGMFLVECRDEVFQTDDPSEFRENVVPFIERIV